MADHTPPPWEVTEDEDGHTIRMGSALATPNDYEVQHVVTYDHGLTEEEAAGEEAQRRQLAEARANAYLIGAAPDLLAALKAVVAIADRKTDEFDYARAAIAKATQDA